MSINTPPNCALLEPPPVPPPDLYLPRISRHSQLMAVIPHFERLDSHMELHTLPNFSLLALIISSPSGQAKTGVSQRPRDHPNITPINGAFEDGG